MIVLANKIEHIQSKRQMLFFITNTSHFCFVSSLYHAVGEKSIINAKCERKEMVFRELFPYNSLRNQGLGGPCELAAAKARFYLAPPVRMETNNSI